MSNLVEQNDLEPHPAIQWSRLCGYIAQDLSSALIGFLSNGLNNIYNSFFKQLPLVGGLFSRPWVEQVVKLSTGITIGQGLATDIAYYVFRPLGYVIGFLIGSSDPNRLRRVPTYQGQIGIWLNQLSGPTVAGALTGLFVYLMMNEFFSPTLIHQAKLLLSFVAIGAVFGLIAKGVMLWAIYWININNRTAIKQNVEQAKALSAKLITIAKQKAKGRIMAQAKDVIQQMNGPQAQPLLDKFFKDQYEQIAISTYKKIERHFHYLADRACHGDLKALERLQGLVNSSSAIETMLDRLFNQRAAIKIKDDVDTIYDRWQYSLRG